MRFARRAVAGLLAAWGWCALAGAKADAASSPERCLALAVYWEAKAEGHAGMQAVAAVVMNRVAHPAKLPASVVINASRSSNNSSSRIAVPRLSMPS